MRKIGILVSMLFATVLLTTAYAQKDRTLSNGFSINLVTGFPSTGFGAENSSDVPSEMQYGAMWGIQLGNRWYFSPQEKYGFGLMVNWIDFAVAAKVKSNNNIDFGRTTMDFTFFELGPIGTFAINEDMAVDCYYNLRPTLLISGSVLTDPMLTDDIVTGYAGFGLSNTLGAAFRWKVLNVGLEYVLGGINCTGTVSGLEMTGETTTIDLPDAKLSTNSVRIILGVKF